jgi:hypothetical protein
MGVLQLFDTFYVNVGDSAPTSGDIYWVPVPAVDEVPRVLDVCRVDPRVHDAFEYRILQVERQHFTERATRLPLKLLTLEATEELLIAKAKRRPAIVLYGCCVGSLGGGESAAEQRQAGHLLKECYVVAPMYSTATPSRQTSFFPQLVARIRCLLYPQFACLPTLGHNDAEPGEIVRLDRLVTTYLGRGCERTGIALHPEILQLIKDQLAFVVNGVKSAALQDIEDIVRGSLPEALR